MMVSSLAPGLSDALGQGYAMVALLTTGFFMTACLVVFCLLNIDGYLARSLLGSGGPDGAEGESGETAASKGEADVSEARRAACESIGDEYDLTRREVDVLDLFSRGLSAQKTALALSISVNTVNTHAMTLYRKLDIHSKQELVELVDGREQA